MNLLLVRDRTGEICTLGRLWVDGVFECYTLEDPVRDLPHKVKGKTAIWGDRTYRVVIDYSPKYKRPMLHVLDVPLFTGIRVHAGNDAEDTEGCILVGVEQQNCRILRSREALVSLFSKVDHALTAGEDVWLTVANPIDRLEAV